MSLLTAAAFSMILAGRASAQPAAPTPDPQEELREDAAALQAMTDAEFLTLAARKTDDQSGASSSDGSGQAVDSSGGQDSRLSRPRSLSMIYETLAAYEFHLAGRPAERRPASELLIDPATRKTSAAWTRLSARISAKRASLQSAGRGVGPSNKRLAALQKSLAPLTRELADQATKPARKAELHARIGKVYEQMSAAARYQASVKVVDASVYADSGDPDHPAGRRGSKAAQPTGHVAAAPRRAAKASAPNDASAADATPAAGPSEEDAIRPGQSEMNDLEKSMQDQIQKRQAGQ